MMFFNAHVIGGSVAARAAVVGLAQAGLTVARSGPVPNDDGVVILWPRGIDALQRLGVKSAKALGDPVRTILYRDGEGALLAEVAAPTGTVMVERQTVVANLLRATTTAAGDNPDSVSQIRPVRRGLSVLGSAGRVTISSIVIGAGGTGDPVRQALLGDDDRIEPGTCFFGSAAAPDGLSLRADTIEQVLCGSCWLAVFPRQKAIAWVLRSVSPDLNDAKEQLPQPFRRLVEASPPPGRAGVRRWLHPLLAPGGPRFALVGDSWRSASPEIGLGVTWALEDAVRLRDCVYKAGDPVAGVAEYVRDSARQVPEAAAGRIASGLSICGRLEPLRTYATRVGGAALGVSLLS